MTTVALLADNWHEGLPAERNQASQDFDWWQALRIVREASRSSGKAVLIAFKTLDRIGSFCRKIGARERLRIRSQTECAVETPHWARG